MLKLPLVCIFISLFVTGCANNQSSSILAPIEIGEDLSYLMVAHGIGRHCIGYSAPLIDEIAHQRKLGRLRKQYGMTNSCTTYGGGTINYDDQKAQCLYLKNCFVLDRKVSELGELVYGYLTVHDLLDPSTRKVKLRVFELTWSPTTDNPKNYVLNTQKHEKKSGYQINDLIHNGLINRSLSDAILYLGKYKDQIQLPFFDAICFMSMPPETLYRDIKLSNGRCDMQAILDKNNEILGLLQDVNVSCEEKGIIKSSREKEAAKMVSTSPRVNIVTTSLGSKILFDIVNGLGVLGENKSLQSLIEATYFKRKNLDQSLNLIGLNFASRVERHYMLANQIPLLALSDVSSPSEKEINAGYFPLPENNKLGPDLLHQSLLRDIACTDDKIESVKLTASREKTRLASIKRELRMLNGESTNLSTMSSQQKIEISSLQQAANADFDGYKKKIHDQLYNISKLFLAVHSESESSPEKGKDTADKTSSLFKSNLIDSDQLVADEYPHSFKHIEFSSFILSLIDSKGLGDINISYIENKLSNKIVSEYVSDNPDFKPNSTSLYETIPSIIKHSNRAFDYEIPLMNAKKNLYDLSKEISNFKSNVPSKESKLDILKERLIALGNRIKEIAFKIANLNESSLSLEKRIHKILTVKDRLISLNRTNRQKLAEHRSSFEFLHDYGKALEIAPELIAFSDKADVLNYDITKGINWYYGGTKAQKPKTVLVELDKSFALPGLYADLIGSHNNYLNDPKVAWYIACGKNHRLGAEKCLDDNPFRIKGDKKWE